VTWKRNKNQQLTFVVAVARKNMEKRKTMNLHHCSWILQLGEVQKRKTTTYLCKGHFPGVQSASLAMPAAIKIETIIYL